MKPRESQPFFFLFPGVFCLAASLRLANVTERDPVPRRAFDRSAGASTNSWTDRTTRHAFGLHSTIRVAARAFVRTLFERLEDDRSLSADIERVAASVRDGRVVAAVETEVGALA